MARKKEKNIQEAVDQFIREAQARRKQKKFIPVDLYNLEATIWLFEVMTDHEEKAIRLLMIDLVAHILSTDKEIFTRRNKGTPAAYMKRPA